MLLQEQKRHHRMRAQTHKTRHPPAKHPPHPLHPKHPPQQPPQPFLLRRRHDTRLNNIHGAANRRRHEPGQKTGAEMRVQVIVQGRARQDQRFEPVVGGQLRSGHEDGAHAVGGDAPEKGARAFLAGHADEAVEGVGVVAAVGGGEGGVVLHADVEDVGGVAGDAAEEAGGGGHGDEGGEGGGGGGGCEGGFEFFVDAEAGGGVGYLAEEGGGELGGGEWVIVGDGEWDVHVRRCRDRESRYF